LGLNLLEHLEAGHVGHPLVGEENAHFVGAHELEPARGGRRRQDREPIGAGGLEDREVLGLVVDEQDVPRAATEA
jgi:hypothetical protein